MDNVQDELKQIEERIQKAWHEIVEMEKRLTPLPNNLEELTNKINDLEKTIKQTNSQITNINTHYEDYFSKNDPSIKSKLEMVIEHHATIDQFLKITSSLKGEFEDFKEFIYGSETTGKLGFKKDLELLFETSKKTNDTLSKTWSEAYQILFEKIEGLLPGATATGLSKAYQDQKKSYKLPAIIWSIVFILAVGGMMTFGIYSYNESNIKTLTETLQLILARLPFFIPAIWLAIFSSKQQSQYKRLQQEYIYKETLAKSYEAYKREIEILPDGEERNILQQNLITSMIEMCGYNPSLTLENKSHDEKPPIISNQLFKGLLRNKKPITEEDL